VPIAERRDDDVVSIREDRGGDVDRFSDSPLDWKTSAIDLRTHSLDDDALRESQ
jgi:hypothetical protein